jgi:5,5'-dehydrodivanillate O-demethylase
MENSLDPVHVEWLHQHMRNYVVGKLGQDERKRQPQSHKKIGFDVFDHGIVKRRVVDDKTEQDEDWAVGHPVIFPNFLKSGSAATPVFQIRVPVDDENTAYWWYRVYTRASNIPVTPQAADAIPLYSVPVPQLDPSGRPQWDILDNNSGQDIVAWITQGAIADRSHETLARSDKGVVLYRRLLKDALNKVEQGEDPMNVFRDPSMERIDLAVETNKLGVAGNVLGGARAGNTSKYSPILKQAGTAGR